MPDEDISVRVGNYYVLGNQTGYGLKYDAMHNFVPLWPHPYNYEHPPLAKLLLGYSGLIFSRTTFGYRFLGALLGAALPLLVFLIARKFMSGIWALLPAAVVAIDPLLVQVSRLATPDTYFLFFAVAAFVPTAYSEGWPGVMTSGILMGLSIASKWLGLYALLALLVYQILSRRGLFARVALPVITFVTSIVVYVEAYFEYFVGGPVYTIAYRGTAPQYLLLGPHTFADFFRLQLWMIDFASLWHVAGPEYGYVILSPLTYVLQGVPSAPVYAFNILLFLAVFQLVLAYLLKMKPPLILVLWVLAGLLPLFDLGFVWYLALEIPGSALMISWFASRVYVGRRKVTLFVPVLLLLTEAVVYLSYLPR
ncbi:MAG: glycosyltransferase family 39 protein [Nitrososphaerales archaeon]|nr:glycosyltransferase family 39 protein [Nitrososphaerales archaeon]